LGTEDPSNTNLLLDIDMTDLAVPSWDILNSTTDLEIEDFKVIDHYDNPCRTSFSSGSKLSDYNYTVNDTLYTQSFTKPVMYVN
jgi:hypothetical protein